MLNATSLFYIMQVCADAGSPSIDRNLYPRQERKLLQQGFALKKVGEVPGHPDQFRCRISWEDAVEGTVAYELCERYIKSSSERSDPCVPNDVGGGWDQL